MKFLMRSSKRLAVLALTMTGLIIWPAVLTHASLFASSNKLNRVMAVTSRKTSKANFSASLNQQPAFSGLDRNFQAKAREAYGQLPLRFEANRGQVDERVKFLSRANDYTLYLTATEAVMTLRVADQDSRNAGSQEAVHLSPGSPPAIIGSKAAVLRMKFKGASNRASVRGIDELQGRSNYFIGSNPQRWQSGVESYGKVKYESIYPGIDLIYYGKGRELEYDFKVAPGADYRAIRVEIEGAQKVRVEASGELVIETWAGQVRQPKPEVYQEINGRKNKVEGWYRVRGEREVGFEIGDYDRSRRLVIDPVLTYSSYLGGNVADEGIAVALDGAGNLYVTGRTTSADFPKTTGAFQQTIGGNIFDAFVTKLNPAGTALVYSTYLGGPDGAGIGDQGDQGFGIAVDDAGSAYVVGQTTSPNFPTTAGAVQRTLAGSPDAFITKLNPAGAALVYSTYLGGSHTTSTFVAGQDVAYSIALDGARNAYVTGRTNSVDFPIVSALQSALGGGGNFIGGDAFITKLNPAGTALVFSTYFGGNGEDSSADIALDSEGNIYIAGLTGSGNLKTTEGAFQKETHVGSIEAFAAKLDNAASTVSYLTYLGGSFNDSASGIAVDQGGNAYVVGTTESVDFPTLNAFQSANNSGPAFKSTDGGATWAAINTGLNAFGVNSIAIDPKTPSTVYAATDRGLFKSVDSGATWTGANEGLMTPFIRSVAVDPKVTTTVYAGVNSAGVYKSTDAGATWNVTGLKNTIIIGLPLVFADINQLVIDPVTPSNIYAVGSALINTGPLGPPLPPLTLFKTTDAGSTWSALAVSIQLQVPPETVVKLAIDPKMPATLYAGVNPTNTLTTSNVYKSTNGGISWTASGLDDLFIQDLIVDPINTATVYAGVFNDKKLRPELYKSVNGGASWARINGASSVIAIDPQSSSTLYGIAEGSLVKSTDAGASWKLSNLANIAIKTLVINPSNTQVLYVGSTINPDAFVTKLNPTGTALVYSTYLGGKSVDGASAVAIDGQGNAYIAGLTSSADFPTKSAVQASIGASDASSDAFITELNASGSALVYSTYLGGAIADGASSIAVDSFGSAYITGFTSSTNFPVVAPFQRQYGGGNLDAFVAKISLPRIISVTTSGKNLIVTGEGFASGAVILINNLEQKTRNDETSPTSVLVGKKAVKTIAPGQQVTVQVRNPDGTVSNPFSFRRPVQ